MSGVRLHPWNIEISKLGAPVLPPSDSLQRPLVPLNPDPHPDLPYENLAFEGGGIKAISYIGALEVLEEAGLYPQHIRRVSGASSGSFLAAMVAVGATSADLHVMLADTNLGSVMRDARFGVFSHIYNIFTVYGLNPGSKLLDFLGEQLRQRTGSADVTFQQVLERCGRELCVPVTNLTRMCTEYCHPKTTPHMPVRLAVGMSMSLPVLMAPYRLVRALRNIREVDLYTDGGLLCNYPIHAFDGWWLSLDSTDTFLSRLNTRIDLADQMHDHVRFRPRNDKTLGFTVFEHGEIDMTKRWALPGAMPPLRPDTPLAWARNKKEQRLRERTRKSADLARAATRLIDAMSEIETDGDGYVDVAEASRLFESGRMTAEDAQVLFDTVDIEQIFRQLDHDEDGRISYSELLRFVDSSNVPLTAHLALVRSDPNGVTGFFSRLFQTVWAHMRRVTLHPEDRHRTVAIDTDYVSTADFHLQAPDREFLIETGRRAARAFLAHRRASVSE
ncbi:MAG: patatin-like phospholipase family protein [Myxococcales bacterium]|nr:patatin-like phospholipase family protein [Myxococcales bacterium]